MCEYAYRIIIYYLDLYMSMCVSVCVYVCMCRMIFYYKQLVQPEMSAYSRPNDVRCGNYNITSPRSKWKKVIKTKCTQWENFKPTGRCNNNFPCNWLWLIYVVYGIISFNGYMNEQWACIYRICMYMRYITIECACALKKIWNINFTQMYKRDTFASKRTKYWSKSTRRRVSIS